jgi:hypothetical protein
MASTKSPAYKRGFTVKQNYSAHYFSRAIIKPDIAAALGVEYRGRVKPKLPKMLDWQAQQLSRVMARATQMDRRVVELETFVKNRVDAGIAEHAARTGQELSVPLVIAMTPDEFQRWQYVQDASARAELTAARLRKELREELEHLRGAGTPDLVAQMALHQDEAELVEPEAPEAEPTGEGDPD